MTSRQIVSDEFEDIIKARVVVQFTASWCGPCKVLTKTIESNASRLTMPFVKLDVDDAPDIIKKHRVMSVPTLIIFDSGKEIKRIVGSKTIDQLLAFIE